MLASHQVEELISVVSAMSRQALIESFLGFHGSFPVDFTPEFLERQPTDRLQHIFVALCLQTGHVPSMPMCDAA